VRECRPGSNLGIECSQTFARQPCAAWRVWSESPAARERDDPNAVRDESWNLGADLDRYVEAIGAASETNEAKRHASVYPLLSTILICGSQRQRRGHRQRDRRTEAGSGLRSSRRAALGRSSSSARGSPRSPPRARRREWAPCLSARVFPRGAGTCGGMAAGLGTVHLARRRRSTRNVALGVATAPRAAPPSAAASADLQALPPMAPGGVEPPHADSKPEGRMPICRGKLVEMRAARQCARHSQVAR